MMPREDKEDSVKTPCKKEPSDYPAFAASVTVYDFLGRVVSVSTPNSSLLTPPSYSVTSNVYDGATSRLLRVSRTGSPDTLYAYDALGNVIATATALFLPPTASHRLSRATRWTPPTSGGG